MRCTLREHQLDCALGERNDVMLHGLEAVDVFVDAVCTQTDLAAVAKLLDRVVTVHVAGDKFLCLGGGGSHFLFLKSQSSLK
jgi:methenyltetrahydromethanopterin cyclohydrolase